MGDSRFDNRSESRFRKDIKFGTQIESYFFQEWLKHSEDGSHLDVFDWDHNGVANDGSFVKSGTNTGGADYKVTMDYDSVRYTKMPLEIKFVPTAGKFTLKVADIKAYIGEYAGILFIYNTNPQVKYLRKPKDYDFPKHIERIEASCEDLMWAILTPQNLKEFYDAKENSAFPVPYMGNKMGILLTEDEYDNWFWQEEWCV